MNRASPHRLLPIVLSLALAAPAAPQQQTLVESIEVRVANIDVVVRDRAGNPVTGLTKDDFELLEDGVKQPITNFYEVSRAVENVPEASPGPGTQPAVSAAPPPAELRQRRFVLFVDSFSIQPSRKKAILDSLSKFIDTRMRPGDQAMLISWRIGLDVITPFTSDPAAIHAGIDRLSRAAPRQSEYTSIQIIKHDLQTLIEFAQTNRMSWEEAYTRAISEINGHAEDLMNQQERMLDVLGRMMSVLGGVEGKKVLVLAGEHLPEHPGAELYRYAYDQFASAVSGTTTRRNQTPFDLQAVTGVVGNHAKQSIGNLADRASAYGVTIYTIDAADTGSEVSAENDLAPDSAESFSRYENTAAALQTLASVTGGVAITHTSNFDFAFDTIAHDLDSYYSLGYKPVEKGGGSRRIAVKTKNPAYTVRARETFVIESAEEQMADRVLANLYTDAIPSSWPIAVRTGTPKADGGKFLIPVQVVIPSTITLLPQGNDLVGGFTLYFVVGSEDGKASEMMRRPQPVRIPAAAERNVRAKPMTYSTAIRVGAGESLLSVGIVDQTAGVTGFARMKVVAR